MWFLNRGLLFLLNKWKEKQLEKQSMILLLSLNSGFRWSKEEKTLLNLLFISTKWPLMRPCWHLVRELSKRKCGHVGFLELYSMRNLRIWLAGRAWALSWDFLLSFWRCRWIGMSPAIASIPNNRAALNYPTIHEAAHLWSFPNDFRGYKRGALE